MKNAPKYTKEQEESIIKLFHNLENNTIANISKITGIGYSKVSTTLNRYLDKKIKPKSDHSIMSIEVVGAIQIKPNGGFVAY